MSAVSGRRKKTELSLYLYGFITIGEQGYLHADPEQLTGATHAHVGIVVVIAKLDYSHMPGHFHFT